MPSGRAAACVDSSLPTGHWALGDFAFLSSSRSSAPPANVPQPPCYVAQHGLVEGQAVTGKSSFED